MKKQMNNLNIHFLNMKFTKKEGMIVIVPVGSLKLFFLGFIIHKENFFSFPFPNTLRKINQVKDLLTKDFNKVFN